MNGLHFAAINGSTERTLAVLARGEIDIDQGDPEGITPLMFASFEGHARVVKILLNKGANFSLAADDTFTALLASAQGGHIAITKMLLKAGADVQAVNSLGDTSLHMASQRGHLEVMEMLIEAGANPNSRRPDGSTPLMMAAYEGYMDAIELLLRAGANPLLASREPTGDLAVALDMAAQKGRSNVVCVSADTAAGDRWLRRPNPRCTSSHACRAGPACGDYGKLWRVSEWLTPAGP